MSELKKGQRVKVELEGEIQDLSSFNDCARITGGEGEYSHYVFLGSDRAGVKVTLADPADWPPQVGDIWEAEGREYYVRGSAQRMDCIIIEPFNTSDPGPRWQYTRELLGDFKALNPVLARRRGQ